MQLLNTEMQEQHSRYGKQHYLVFGRITIFSRTQPCSKSSHGLKESPGNSWFQVTASQCYHLRDQKASRNQKSQAGTGHSPGCLKEPLPLWLFVPLHALQMQVLTLASPPPSQQTCGAPVTSRTMPGLQGATTSECRQFQCSSHWKSTISYSHGHLCTLQPPQISKPNWLQVHVPGEPLSVP